MRINQETHEPSPEAAPAAASQSAGISTEIPAHQPKLHANGAGGVRAGGLGRATRKGGGGTPQDAVSTAGGRGAAVPPVEISPKGDMAATGIFRLVATDLDGTLLRADETISERTRQALQQVQAAGATVVLVSGRPARTLRLVAQHVGVTGLAICGNGSVIYDLEHDAIVQQASIAPELVTRLVIQFREVLPGVSFAFESGQHISMEPAYFALRLRVPKVQPILGDALEFAQQPVAKLIVLHPDLGAEALMEITHQIAGDTVSASHSGFAFVEITAPGVDKGRTLESLSSRLGVKASEVIAFGDMPNDLPMLAWVGRGIAMANAHPEVLRQAHEITLSNMEDGVAVVLERLLAENKIGMTLAPAELKLPEGREP
jgi:Cof subfamily protein (haloacid dehalogenase superfamily)